MVTRRAVLKGTAAASIGAIAAAHGAAPVEAAVLDVGYGQLTGGAIGGFYKYSDAFQVSLKFNKIAADIFFKEDGDNTVTVFYKFFNKNTWTDFDSKTFESLFPNLQDTDLYFSKFDSGKAEFFLKDRISLNSIQGTIEPTTDGVFYKFDGTTYNGDLT